MYKSPEKSTVISVTIANNTEPFENIPETLAQPPPLHHQHIQHPTLNPTPNISTQPPLKPTSNPTTIIENITVSCPTTLSYPDYSYPPGCFNMYYSQLYRNGIIHRHVRKLMSYRFFNITIPPPVLNRGIVYYCYDDNQCKDNSKNSRYMNQILINSKVVKENDPSVFLSLRLNAYSHSYLGKYCCCNEL